MSDLDKAFSQYLIDKETPPPPPASETTDENDMSFGDYLDQVLTTIGDIPDMAIRGALRGLGETAFTLGIVDEPQIKKYRKAMDASSKLAVTEGSNRIVSSLGEGVSQIGVTALPAFRALRAMGMGRTTSGIIAEAVGGAVAGNPDDPNLGNLAQTLMGEDRSGPFADAMNILATNPEDPAIMNRARNAIQDSTIGLAFEGLIRSPGAARAMVDRWKSGRSAIPFGEMRENIAEAGARADERLKSTMSGSTLSANPVGAMGDMAVSAAGRLARTDNEIAPVFHSAVLNAVDALPMEKGGGDQMRAMIAKSEGVKAEEMSWIGLDDFLKGKKSVTKQEVRDYVEANQVRVEEVTKSMDGTTGVGEEAYEFAEPVIDDAYDAYSHRAGDIAYDIDQGNEYFVEDVVFHLQKLRPTKYPETETNWADSLRNHFENGGTITDLDENLRSDVIDAVDDIAKAEYLDNPYVTVKSADGNYDIYGNDDVGFQITRRSDGARVNDSEIYSLEEAKIQAYTDALDYGYVGMRGGGDTLFEDYALPGGQNYREVLLTIGPRLENYPTRQAYDEAIRQQDARGGAFERSHFDESNVLAHLRLTDRTGPDGEKILFIEEIQSDWHQKGRKQGYKIPLEKLNEQTRNDYLRMVELENSGPRTTAEERIEYSRLKEKYGGDSEKIIGKIPDAPLKKNWHEMSFRRVARMAAEEGYDRIAWTPGKMQAERYDLSKRISKISYDPDTKKLFAYEKDGYSPVISEIVSEDKLADHIGKEAAERLLATTRETIPTNQGDTSKHILKGADLEVGGEGMKGFYDKMLKNYASKWGKKFDSKVGVTNLDNEGYGAEVDGELTEYFATRKQAQDYIDSLPNVDKSRIVESGTGEVWTMPVTKKMKDSVLRKGVPFFGVAGATAMVGQQENNNDN